MRGVRDAGPGIEPAAQARVFDRFWQADSTAEGGRRAGHAGLGLAICQRLVHAQGAVLRVDSAPEQGTRFSFELELPPVGR